MQLFNSSWGVWFGLQILKTIHNCIVVFHLMCLSKPSFKPAGYKVGWHFPFPNWCKVWFLLPVSKSDTKISIYLCIYLSVYLPTYLYLSIYLPTYLPTYLPACLPACLRTYVPNLRTYIRTYLRMYIHTYVRSYVPS